MTRIAIIGLGYVGLPLAVEFARHFPVTGFDLSAARVADLLAGRDRTQEVPDTDLAQTTARFTTDPAAIAGANTYIVTVPTPVDGQNRPDMSALRHASETVAAVLSPGDTVIYESTVYPGATEEVCVPVLENSGLVYNRDFTVGYSPERINPGDATHRLPDIVKVTAGSTVEAAARIDALYRRIIPAGTHRAPSIAVAEAAKVIENTQRDLNIALVNELALIFERLGLDTGDVLAAAGTKWNFLPFRPGLVGGHCIGVDPYYLTHKAQAVGYNPEVILAGRRINDTMPAAVATRLVKSMIAKGTGIDGARVLVLGLTFKENCPDTRNTKVVALIEELRAFGLTVDVHDPWVDPQLAQAAYGFSLVQSPEVGAYAATVLAVAHRDFGSEVTRYTRPGGVTFDLRGHLPRDAVD
ncbi:MAG: nucleotide sugar dehydrogenase, partial [Pseudomonadota bacterium]